MHPSMQRSLAQAAALSPQQLCSVCGRAFPCRPRGSWGLRIRLQEQEQGTRRAAQKLSQQACRHQKFAVGQRAADSRALRHSFLRVQESAAGDWAALARGSPDEDDDELMSSINEARPHSAALQTARRAQNFVNLVQLLSGAPTGGTVWAGVKPCYEAHVGGGAEVSCHGRCATRASG